MKTLATILMLLLLQTKFSFAQDTTVIIGKRNVWLSEVVVRSNINYKKIINQILNDTSFYKSFRSLRILNYTAYNTINIQNKNDEIIASLNSTTQQIRQKGCRTMQKLSEQTTGDFYNADSSYKYLTAQLYASLFFTKGKICNESNIVKGFSFNADGKSGNEKYKEQLKMLFFMPGKKIPGLPLIGNKLDLYDEDAAKLYDYKLETTDYNGIHVYKFSITPKLDLGFFKRRNIVVDEMTTLFDVATLQVLYRKYQMSYKAGIYSFDVNMEVEMTKLDDWVVPSVMRYNGSWNVLFSKKEKANFTATLSHFVKEENE